MDGFAVMCVCLCVCVCVCVCVCEDVKKLNVGATWVEFQPVTHQKNCVCVCVCVCVYVTERIAEKEGD